MHVPDPGFTRRSARAAALALLAALVVLPTACRDDGPAAPDAPAQERLEARRPLAEGRAIFRHDDFGNWRFWTDTLRLHDLVQDLQPATALALGLRVDADAVPEDELAAVLSDPDLLKEPAVTRRLLELDAVVGVNARVEEDVVTRIGITCALCHSEVDDRITAGIGSRVDGQPNRDLAVGTIVSLTPGLPDELRDVYASWPAGFFDPRFNVDGISDPVVIPPAYGLRGVALETYTGEGPVSYWNTYVAVLEMHGRGSFRDPRLGIDIRVPPQEDEVKKKLPALRQYQFSLEAPAPPDGFFDPQAARRGRELFAGAAGCTDCHTGPRRTDAGRIHAPEETGMDPAYARRGTTGGYRTTPLRGLWQNAPYFHDGSAETLRDVVQHYDDVLGLGLSAGQKVDLLEYLKSL